MKIRAIVIFLIISLTIIAGTSVFAQDCSLNGAIATDDCPNGTGGDDIFIITGEVNIMVRPEGGDDIVDLSNGGVIDLRGVGGYGIGDSGGDLIVIGGIIYNDGTWGLGVYQNSDGDLISSATIITTGGQHARGINEQGNGDAINNGNISTNGLNAYGMYEHGDGDNINNGCIETLGDVSVGMMELQSGDAINNGCIETATNGSRGIIEYAAGDVINNGIIITSGGGAPGIQEQAEGNVYNNGVIIAQNSVGIYTVFGTENDTVINNGSVTGGTAAIETGGGNDTVINNGTANGNINTDGENDTVVNNGTVNGDVNLGDGDDTMHVRNTVNGNMDGGNGTDTLIFEFTIVGTRYDLEDVAQEIADANPAGGTVIINGQRYTWTNFESLVELLSLIDVNPSPCASDERINIFDCHAPVALYYNNGLEVWAVHPDTGNGTYAFTVTQAQIDAVGIPESGTVLIAQGTHPDTGLPIALYRHADEAFQVNAFFPDMKPYVGIWQWYGGFTNLSGEQG